MRCPIVLGISDSLNDPLDRRHWIIIAGKVDDLGNVSSNIQVLVAYTFCAYSRRVKLCEFICGLLQYWLQCGAR